MPWGLTQGPVSYHYLLAHLLALGSTIGEIRPDADGKLDLGWESEQTSSQLCHDLILGSWVGHFNQWIDKAWTVFSSASYGQQRLL